MGLLFFPLIGVDSINPSYGRVGENGGYFHQFGY